MPGLAPFLATNYVVQAPAFLVWLAGLVVALALWRRHPRVSLFAALGLLLAAVRAVVAPWIDYWIRNSGLGLTQIGIRFAVLNVVSAVISAAAWTLVLIAVFGWRSKRQAPDVA